MAGSATTRDRRWRVRVTEVIHRGDAGFRILEVLTQTGEQWSALGRLDHLLPGDVAWISGTLRTDNTYGEQLRADRAVLESPDTGEALAAALALTPHVADDVVARLVADDTRAALDALDADCAGTLKGAGLSEAKTRAAARDWNRRRDVRRLRAWLADTRQQRLATQIVDAEGHAAVGALLSDPYLLSERYGVALGAIDARERGTPERRAQAAVLVALRDAAGDGHTGVARDVLLAQAARSEPAVDADTLDALVARDVITLTDDFVQPRLLAAQEQAIADALTTLRDAPPAHAEVEPSPSTFLTPDQRRAVDAAFAHRLSVIVGGPGTGKSTLVAEIVTVAAASGLSVGLCAPTGKAARRLAQATDTEAHTIHSLARVAPPDDYDPWDLTQPEDPRLAQAGCDDEYDLVVCDEASMLTCELMLMLLACVEDDTHLVLVGDADQLPPVGVGELLDTIVATPEVAVTTLTEIKRQSAGSQIPVAAQRVLTGSRPQADPPAEGLGDFFLSIAPSSADARARAVSLASGRMAEHLGVDPIWGVQVLAPTNQELDLLNRALGPTLNPSGRSVGETGLRVGDKVLQTLNVRDQGLVNGDLLRLEGSTRGDTRLRLRTEDGDEHTISAKLAHRLRPAYAMTAHRAQGSEFPGVIVVLTTHAARPLNRNWLYTAITRAQRCCVVVAEEAALATALGREIRGTRQTGLPSWLAA